MKVMAEIKEIMRYIIKDINKLKKKYKDYGITRRKVNGIETYIIKETKSHMMICWTDDRKIGSGTLFKYDKITGSYNSDIDINKLTFMQPLIQDGLVVEKNGGK